MEIINQDDVRVIFLFGLHLSRMDKTFSTGQRRILDRYLDYMQLNEDDKVELLNEQFSLAQALKSLESEEARRLLIKTLCAMHTQNGVAKNTELEFINRVITQLGDSYELPPTEAWEDFENELALALPLNSNQATILVAEDDEDLGRMVKLKLEHEGFRVNWVTDGNSALEAIRNSQPELVLLDVNMPGMSGFEVLEAVRGNSNLKDTRIMMMTAQNTESDVRRAVNLGSNGYIVKPFRPTELVSRINKVLQGDQRR